LKAPVMRVTGPDIPIPLARLENYYIPDKENIKQVVEKIIKF
jgi:pyruvate dehydrogenase E1 component beta subunit